MRRRVILTVLGSALAALWFGWPDGSTANPVGSASTEVAIYETALRDGAPAPSKAAEPNEHQALRDALSSALSLIPAPLRPASVQAHVVSDALNGPAFFHKASGSLILSESFSAAPNDRVLVHELGHLVTRGPRPTRLLGQRYYLVLDEAFADYFVRVLLPSGETSPAPVTGAAEWAQLVMPSFSPYGLANDLSQRLARRSSSLETLMDFAEALRNRGPALGDAPRELAAEFVQKTNKRSRRILEDTLREWMGAELFPQASVQTTREH